MNSWLIVVAALASALMGGVFFAFSSFVMPALGRIPAAEGIRAMQRINIDVFHWSFVLAFFGTPLLCVGLAVQAIWHQPEPGAVYFVAAAAVYLLGCFLVTGVGNVPLNNALAKVDAEAIDAAQTWTRYLVGWTRWNHIRTAACMATAGTLVLGLIAR